MNRLPHIVIFNPDQWRGDVLGHLGNPAAVTPNLDRAVETDFVSFRHAFCQNPVCTPSRCSFMSGWYPHVAGHRTMHHMLRKHEPVLLKILKDSGYHVWWGGKNDLVPAQHGYDDYCDEKHDTHTHPARKEFLPAPHAANDWRGDPDSDAYYSFYRGRLEAPPGRDVYLGSDWYHLEGAIQRIHDLPKEKPTCIYLALGYPHPPYAVEEPYYSLIDRARIPRRIAAPPGWWGKPSLLRGIAERQHLQAWTEDRWTELRATYYGMCARVDHQFGLVLGALREAGIYDDAAVFFFSDHGDFTGDYGLVEKTQNTFEDCLTRVPFLVKLPAWYGVRPRVSQALVELLDFPATVHDLAGITPRCAHFGRSLVPLLTGETDAHRDAVFCEGGRRHGETTCMERQSNATPASLYWPRLSLQYAEGPEHTKAVMIRTTEFKYVRRLYEQDELYDLRNDPEELRNRINDPSLSAVAAAMRERILTWYLETCDAVPDDSDRRR